MARKGAPALYELLGRARGGKSPDGKGPDGKAPFVPIKVQPRVPGTSGIGLKTASPKSTRPSTVAGSVSSSPEAASAIGAPSVGMPSSASGGPGKRAKLPLPSWGLIGAAFAIVSLVLVYQLGVSQGSGGRTGGDQLATDPATTEATRAGSQSGLDLASGSGRRDPVAGTSAAAPQQPAKPSSASENRTAPASESVSSGAAEEGQALGPTPKGIDPRQSGLNYFVVASVLEANADKMVQFCRDRGLDAWVVPDHNGRLREITVLPGVPKSELDGARAKALKARILKVGLQWKAAGRGNADFSGCYPKLYNG